jgi:hypothetical protein
LKMPISIVSIRNRTPSVSIGYGSCFYFSGLSLIRTSQILSSCYQTKPCFHLELDMNAQTKEAFLKEKEG